MKWIKTLLAAAIACSLFYNVNSVQDSTPTDQSLACSTQKTALLSPGYSKSKRFNNLISPDSTNTLLLCSDGSGALYDTILILSYSKKNSKLSITSLPRDIYVPYNQEICDQLDQLGLFTQKGIFKLNAVSAVGKLIHYDSCRFDDTQISFMADILEEMTGISVHDYAIINFETFKKLIDAVDGVNVHVACDIRDASGQLILAKGKQKLDGTQALLYARTRKFYDEKGNVIPAQGDHTRKEHQLSMIREVLPQLAQKAKITKMPQIINILRNDVKHSLSLSEIYQYYRLTQDAASGKISTETNLITGRAIDPFQDGCAYLEFE